MKFRHPILFAAERGVRRHPRRRMPRFALVTVAAAGALAAAALLPSAAMRKTRAVPKMIAQWSPAARPRSASRLRLTSTSRAWPCMVSSMRARGPSADTVSMRATARPGVPAGPSQTSCGRT